MNLEKYFADNFEKNIRDHELRCTILNGKTIFYIRPKDHEGATLDYTVKGDRLIPIVPKDPLKKTSGRFFAPITHEELASKITGAFCKYNKNEYESWVEDYKEGPMLLIDVVKKSDGYGIPWHNLSNKIEKDLSKCEFDLENVNITDGWGNTKSIVGFRTLPNGMNYLGICAGGDWENSVFFIIYWSGTELRAYIPTEGNPWNTDKKQAYGNNESDPENAKKRFGNDNYDHIECDPQAIIYDIVNRIKPRS